MDGAGWLTAVRSAPILALVEVGAFFGAANRIFGIPAEPPVVQWKDCVMVVVNQVVADDIKLKRGG